MSEIKVNLGAGPSGINGWLNLDWGILPILAKAGWPRTLLIKLGILEENYNVVWPEFRLYDIRRKLPFGDKSVDFIYCSHVLEHFEKYQVLNILKECQRILKNDGVLRVVVPDIKKIIKIYGEDNDADKFAELIWGYNKSRLEKSRIDRLKEYFIRGHQWSYDTDSMKKIMLAAGFKMTKVESFCQGKTPDLKKLELEGQKKESLYLEASKN